ncbi:MAG TPA: hypothetical protein VK874_15880, partial [Gaiellaceae bacterium]|nr:hypothetical protein [Gaiellaceae bacterium]
VRDEARAQTLLALGRDLARGPRELVLARLAATAAELGTAHAWAEQARDELAAAGVRARLAAFTPSAPGEDAVRLSAQQDVDLLLTDVGPDELERLPAELEELLEGAACDVGLVTALAAPAAEGTARVLVPFGGAEHDWAAVELAAWLARATAGRLVLAGTVGDPDGGRRDASRLLASASLIVQQVAGVAAEPALVDAGAEGVLSAAAGARAVVVGLSDRWRREGVGAERLALARGVAAPTVLVRRGVRPGGLSPAESLTRFTWTIASAVPGGPATGT